MDYKGLRKIVQPIMKNLIFMEQKLGRRLKFICK